MSLALSLLSLSIWALALVLTLKQRRPELVASSHSPNADLVSVIVPARNEEKVITRCITSLLAQDYESLEVIVVNDHSTDDTVETVQRTFGDRENVKLLECPALGPGWVGKTSACFFGARHARGHWLLFTDADSELKAHTVSIGVGYAKNAGLDALSLMPCIEPTGFVSRFAFPVVGYLIRTFYPMEGINEGKGRAFFYGGFTLIKGEAYRRIGGHEAVKGEVVEDKALGQLAQRSGLRIMLMVGRKLLRSQVGGAELSDLWFSAQRVVSAAFRGRRLAALMFSVLLPLFFWLPYLSLLTAVVAGSLVPTAIALSSLAAYIITLYTDVSIDQDAHPLYVFLTPLGVLLIAGSVTHWAIFNSEIVAWKGRKYRIGG